MALAEWHDVGIDILKKRNIVYNGNSGVMHLFFMRDGPFRLNRSGGDIAKGFFISQFGGAAMVNRLASI